MSNIAGQDRRIQSAMLDSLAGSFRMSHATGRLILSLNHGDIADLMVAMRELVNGTLGPSAID